MRTARLMMSSSSAEWPSRRRVICSSLTIGVAERIILVGELDDGAGRRVPGSRPRRLASEPAATLRTMISSGMISTSLISCSRMLMRRMK